MKKQVNLKAMQKATENLYGKSKNAINDVGSVLISNDEQVIEKRIKTQHAKSM